MKVAISHALMPEGMKLLEELGAEVFVADSSDPYDYIDEIKKADALILRMGEFRRPIIEECKNLKVIGITGVGFDHVDVAAAAEYGIPVVVTPGANQHCVAEQVIGYIMMFSKNLYALNEEMHKGNWAYRDAGKGFELYGKTIGIIGCGRIGSSVAAICKAMGMKVIGYDIMGQAQVELCGCEYRADMDDVLRESDFVTLHTVLTPETQNMINKEKLSLMKPTAYLINVARGQIVNEQDLADALNEGRIAGAAVDVYWTEPATLDSPVFTAKNMITTPHTAGIAKEAITRMSTMCVEGCNAVVNGERWFAAVDKSAYDHPHFAEREKQ